MCPGAAARPAGRSPPSALVMPCLLVFGGRNSGEFWPPLNSAEQFDPVEGKWSELPSMPLARDLTAADVHNDEIYIIGGSNNHESALNRCSTRPRVVEVSGLAKRDGLALGGDGELEAAGRPWQRW